MAETRIYTVINRHTLAVHLVRANHPSRAISWVAKDTFRASVSSQDELVELVAGGAKVIDADETADAGELA